MVLFGGSGADVDVNCWQLLHLSKDRPATNLPTCLAEPTQGRGSIANVNVLWVRTPFTVGSLKASRLTPTPVLYSARFGGPLGKLPSSWSSPAWPPRETGKGVDDKLREKSLKARISFSRCRSRSACAEGWRGVKKVTSTERVRKQVAPERGWSLVAFRQTGEQSLQHSSSKMMYSVSLLGKKFNESC